MDDVDKNDDDSGGVGSSGWIMDDDVGDSGGITDDNEMIMMLVAVVGS